MKPNHCLHCGSELPAWKDIAAAMREMVEVVPVGLKPMLLQAAAEITALRAIVKAADRVDADTAYKWAPEAKDYYRKTRALVGDLE